MLDTSKDVLNIVIASCIGAFTIFVCWMLWYVIRVMRQVNSLIDNVKAKIEAIDGILKTIHAKIDHSASALSVLGKGVGQIMEFVKNRRENKSKKTKK